MTTKNLIINNDLGSFIFNEESLNALEEFLVYACPLMNEDLTKRSQDIQDAIDQSYYNHIDKDVRPLVRNLYAILHHSK